MNLLNWPWPIIILSLKVASVSVLMSLPFAILFAWLLARHQFKGKVIIDCLLYLPLVLPPIAMGYLLLITMGQRGIIGSKLFAWFGISFSFNWQGAALAAAMMAFPLMVRTIRSSFESIDTKLEFVAMTLGASRWRLFFTITLPLAIPAILAAMVLAFARSLGEFGATITFVSNIPGETRTIPLAMYSLLQQPGQEEAAAKLCAISILIAFFALALSEWLIHCNKRRLNDLC